MDTDLGLIDAAAAAAAIGNGTCSSFAAVVYQLSCFCDDFSLLAVYWIWYYYLFPRQ